MALREQSLSSGGSFCLNVMGRGPLQEDAPVSLSAAGGPLVSPPSLGAPAAASAAAAFVSSSAVSFAGSALVAVSLGAPSSEGPLSGRLCETTLRGHPYLKGLGARGPLRGPLLRSSSSRLPCSAAEGNGRTRGGRQGEEGRPSLQSLLTTRLQLWGGPQGAPAEGPPTSLHCGSCPRDKAASDNSRGPSKGAPVGPSAAATPHLGLAAALERLKQHAAPSAAAAAAAAAGEGGGIGMLQEQQQQRLLLLHSNCGSSNSSNSSNCSSCISSNSSSSSSSSLRLVGSSSIPIRGPPSGTVEGRGPLAAAKEAMQAVSPPGASGGPLSPLRGPHNRSSYTSSSMGAPRSNCSSNSSNGSSSTISYIRPRAAGDLWAPTLNPKP